MRSRFLVLIVYTLSSLVISKSQDVIGLSYSCLKWGPASDGQTLVTFLRKEDMAGAISLYRAIWSNDMRLVTCEVDTNSLVTERYCALCNRVGTQRQTTARRFNISTLLAPDAPCARVHTSAPKLTKGGTEAKARRKRAWILPGTLWCGKGSEAVRYDQLGMFENADRCCREHDHCLHIIPPFRVNYGVFNPNVFTVSHCECDQRFRLCLLSVNDTISSMVGYSFFNILQVPCFELKQQRQCTEKYWWGMCKIMKEAPYAVFRTPLSYNTSNFISNYPTRDNSDSDASTSTGEGTTESPVKRLHRKSQRRGHGCGSGHPSRGNTFTHLRTKGKGCKSHSAVVPSKIPTVSKAHTTAPLKKMGLRVSQQSTLVTNKKRHGKIKSTGNSLSVYPTKIQVSPQVTSNPFPQTFSPTKSIPSLTQKPNAQPHQLTITAVTKAKKASKQGRCCTSRMLLRGDTFQPYCKICLDQETHSTFTPATPISTSPVMVTRLQALRLKSATEKPKQQNTLWNATTFLAATTKKLKTATPRHKDGKPHKQTIPHLQHDNDQWPMGSTLAQGTHAERSLKQNNALHNITDNVFLCGSLKHLDDCRFKIPPLEKKYDLKNMESKTAYHCDCTSRFAVHFKRFKQPNILPSLLKDFVSKYCFKLPKGKKCHSRKSCPGGFTKASDLLQTLNKIKVKDTTGVQNSGTGRKRGIPVRLYKRCLRLEKEADITAQLT